MNQGPRCVVLMKKNGGEKSHASVPLKPTLRSSYNQEWTVVTVHMFWAMLFEGKMYTKGKI
jgi:hypothetical protein